MSCVDFSDWCLQGRSSATRRYRRLDSRTWVRLNESLTSLSSLDLAFVVWQLMTALWGTIVECLRQPPLPNLNVVLNMWRSPITTDHTTSGEAGCRLSDDEHQLCVVAPRNKLRSCFKAGALYAFYHASIAYMASWESGKHDDSSHDTRQLNVRPDEAAI